MIELVENVQKIDLEMDTTCGEHNSGNSRLAVAANCLLDHDNFVHHASHVANVKVDEG